MCSSDLLELKDRVGSEIIVEDDIIVDTNDVNTAIHALMSLGYTRGEITQVIRKIDITNMDTEEIIRESLKRLSRK